MALKSILHISRYVALLIAYYVFLVPYALLLKLKPAPKRNFSTLEFKTIRFTKADLKEPF